MQKKYNKKKLRDFSKERGQARAWHTHTHARTKLIVIQRTVCVLYNVRYVQYQFATLSLNDTIVFCSALRRLYGSKSFFNNLFRRHRCGCWCYGHSLSQKMSLNSSDASTLSSGAFLFFISVRIAFPKPLSNECSTACQLASCQLTGWVVIGKKKILLFCTFRLFLSYNSCLVPN